MNRHGTSRSVSHDDHGDDNGSGLALGPLPTQRPLLTVTPLTLKALLLPSDKSR